MRHLLHHPELWHLHRRSVGGAFFIGLFCAFMPVPSQMVLAALLAVASRCNLPIAVALVWISNPLTMGPMFYFAYRLGAWLLGVELVSGPWELSWQWFGSRFAAIWWPLTLGCLVCGWVSGLTGTVVSRLLWRFHVIRRWRQRRARRAPGRVKTATGTSAGTDGSRRGDPSPWRKRQPLENGRAKPVGERDGTSPSPTPRARPRRGSRRPP